MSTALLDYFLKIAASMLLSKGKLGMLLLCLKPFIGLLQDTKLNTRSSNFLVKNLEQSFYTIWPF